MPARSQPHKGLTHDNWSNSCPLWQETSKWPMPWHDSSWKWVLSQKLLCGGMQRLPVCQEGQRGSSSVYRKWSGQEVARVNLQVPPKQLELVYFLEPGRGEKRITKKKNVQELGKNEADRAVIGWSLSCGQEMFLWDSFKSFIFCLCSRGQRQEGWLFLKISLTHYEGACVTW